MSMPTYDCPVCEHTFTLKQYSSWYKLIRTHIVTIICPRCHVDFGITVNGTEKLLKPTTSVTHLIISVDKPTCMSCGQTIREGKQYCFSCSHPIDQMHYDD